MKATKKKIILPVIGILILLSAGAALYWFNFTADGYMISVPHRKAFAEIAPHVYLNRNAAMTQDSVTALIQEAEARDRAFYGDLQYCGQTYLIICDDAKLCEKLGGGKDTKTFTFPVKRNYIIISEEFFNLDILAHEITHAELHTRLNTAALNRIPTWFDEGLATQNDYRAQYSAAEWEQQTENGKTALAPEEMDTPAEFYAGTAEDRRFRYLCAKHLVAEWMAAHQQAGLLSLLDALNSGADFDTAFSR